DPAVVRMHPRAVRVEDPRDLDPHAVLAVVIEEQRLGAALALVVARARPDRVHPAGILLVLRMHARVAVDLARRGLQDLRLRPSGKPEHVDCTVHARLRRLHGIALVVHRRRRACEVVDLIDLDVDRKRYVVANELEARVIEQMRDVEAGARVEVVEAKDDVPLAEQPVAGMGAEKARAAGHEHLGFALERRLVVVQRAHHPLLRRAAAPSSSAAASSSSSSSAWPSTVPRSFSTVDGTSAWYVPDGMIAQPPQRRISRFCTSTSSPEWWRGSRRQNAKPPTSSSFSRS